MYGIKSERKRVQDKRCVLVMKHVLQMERVSVEVGTTKGSGDCHEKVCVVGREQVRPECPLRKSLVKGARAGEALCCSEESVRRRESAC
jgi:hypothetical protein